MGLPFQVFIRRSAQKALGLLPRKEQDRIIVSIRKLATNPRPAGASKSSGREAWRIRIGTNRVIYEIDDQGLVVIVVAVGHRERRVSLTFKKRVPPGEGVGLRANSQLPRTNFQAGVAIGRRFRRKNRR